MTINTVLPYTTPEKEARTPNQIRFDRMIDYNKEQVEVSDQILTELEKLNKNMAAVSNVLFKLLEAKIVEPTVKKAVDKPVKAKS